MTSTTIKPSAKTSGDGPSQGQAPSTEDRAASLRGHDFATQEQMLSPTDSKAAPVQMSSGGAGVLRWAAGIDPSTPSTYDAAGGHSYADHGAHTTEEQHRTRLQTGIAPSGRVSRVPNSAPGSSKFDSNELHAHALGVAASKLAEKNTGDRMTKGINGKVGVSGAGTIYKRDGGSEPATDVHVDVQVVNGELNINTAFPTK